MPEIIGTAGNDTIVGTAEDDVIYGRAGNDTLFGWRGHNTVFGEDGNDHLYGGEGVNALYGGEGDDVYFIYDGNDRATELGGYDLIWTAVSYNLDTQPKEWAEGWESVERIGVMDRSSTYAINLTANRLDNEMWGNDGVNWLDGRWGADLIYGFGGSDTYFVEDIGDRVVEYAGGGDSDRVITTVSYALSDNVEQLTAYPGAINLTGNDLANEITGNAGSNTINGKGGADLMMGQGGDDYYIVDNPGDAIIESSGGGWDLVYSSIDYALSDDLERLSAADIGRTDALTLVGNARANEIIGNDGANQLSGQGGSDILHGRAGADTFVFSSSIYVSAVDQLPDFEPGIDKIALDDGEFGGLSRGSLPVDAFVTASSAQDAADRIIYNSATGALLFDADGTGPIAAVQFATVHEGLSLSASDFLVI